MATKPFRYISLFSGIEAASVAWKSLDWEPVAFSEIEPFPCELLNRRFPNVPNLGDITKIDWKPYARSIDIIVGGSPCQSFSIAGNREGLKGESGLMFEYIRAVREVRPRYFVWENVPGALSSESGAAFRQLLTEMDELGYGLAWRVLDAQFFGVPQRRRRVFLVGCLGNPKCAAEILFEPESLRWDTPSSKDKRKSLAESSQTCARSSSYTMQVRCGCAGGGKGALIQEDVSATLSTSNVQTLFQPCYAIQGDIARGAHMGQNGKGWNDDGASYTLNRLDQHAVAYVNVLPFNPTQITSPKNGNNPQWGDPCHTLSATDRAPNVICMADANANAAIDKNVAGTLKVGGEPPIVNVTNDEQFIVRKLTPTECERLQGFPDGWTDIEFKGKPASDAARYKALGNSMAVPVMYWIGCNIERTTNDKATA